MRRKRRGARVGGRNSGDAMTANVRKQGARLSGRALPLGWTGGKDDRKAKTAARCWRGLRVSWDDTPPLSRAVAFLVETVKQIVGNGTSGLALLFPLAASPLFPLAHDAG